jgi:DeoR family fructose operon transcriptional repressor
VDKAFMACNSFSAEKGASTPDINQAETKKLMMSIAAKVIVLFDARKMGLTSRRTASTCCRRGERHLRRLSA